MNKFLTKQKICVKCFNKYRPKSNIQKYCPNCQLIKCFQCKKLFLSNRYNKIFCSKRCYTKWQKGKNAYPNIVGKRGIRPRTYLKNHRDKHGSVEDVEWRNSVFERDNYICQKCGIKGGKLEAHHIKAFKKYPKLRHDINNGITLCVECHKKTNTYGWTNYWKNQYAEKRLAQGVL